MLNCFCFYAKHFSIVIAWYKTIDILTSRYPNSSISQRVSIKMQQSILSYLKKKYSDEIKHIAEEISSIEPKPVENPNIWQCWWQGTNNLEGITKICTNSVKNNSGKYSVILLSWRNYEKYVNIPEIIIKKHKKGKITLTELTDIMRMNLLFQNGGLWLDTTMLVTQPISKDNIELPFYTCREECRDHSYVSDYRWNTSCIGGQKNNPLFGFVAKMFEVYWTHEDELIDYYLFDYLIELGYEYVESIRNEIDNLPLNNPNKHSMQDKLNQTYNEIDWIQLLNNTKFFKLSRKVDYQNEINGHRTFYKYLSEKYS
ncbi:MAG: capsular polysaccharide synthesis protein [Bacteroidaceae bacterium]|nr:capsular polysaccharide synthesis protein [Bacteroidaceae bacterium]